MKTLLATTIALTAFLPSSMTAQERPTDPPALSAITEADLRRDLFLLSGEAMRGREAGTEDELRASVWLAERAHEAGLLPAGDDGTYFQFFPVRRVRQSATGRIAIDGQPLMSGTEVAIVGMSDAVVDASIVWLDDAAGVDSLTDLTGRVAAARLAPPASIADASVSLAEWRYANRAAGQLANRLRRTGAAAVIIVLNEYGDAGFERIAATGVRGRYSLDEGPPRINASQTPTLLVKSSMQSRIAGATRLEARLSIESFVYPSVNVVAKLPGSDPVLRDEVVLFSSHQDHDGVRLPVDGDSTWNGADDNATTSVALLAIGRAFAQQPGLRTALFVWHGAEEKGLLGSVWHVRNPVVPLDRITAVLNGDMIGRNHPDTAALLGVIPPHRNSSDLVRMALDANARITSFVIDSTWDRPDHPENWYNRSDHRSYARADVPSLFFTTLLHPDYHTPLDVPERIDTNKLARMSQWIYATGWTAANSPQRPRLDASGGEP
jgi:hypothetical protein